MMSRGHQQVCDPPPLEGLPAKGTSQTVAAMQSRRLVSCGLVDRDTMKITASDGQVWLHRVERDEKGQPVPGQIDKWLNLILAPGSGPADYCFSPCAAARPPTRPAPGPA